MHIKLATIAIIGFGAVGVLHSTLGAQQSTTPQPAPAPTEQTPATPPAAAPSAPEPAASSGPKTVWDGVFTEAQAMRGQALYGEHCSRCHGEGLMGGEMAPPLTGSAFTANWNGVSIGDLFERTRISMPQDFPGILSGQQNADVLAFMLQENKFPAGKTELNRVADILKQIEFKADKP